ncbi:MAG: hypothetical protein GF317_08875 [Candidatus Lokiarchaeota archaeon]|nr:hypothetical protein [Candidatus Lokiarchaeota archaeon]MBD3199824.1 hypothetical protein [Candidatus Lokiarchaeota archaeon]
MTDFRFITQSIGNWTTIIIAPIMTAIVAIRLWNEYKSTNQLNYVRLIIFFIFLAFSWAIIPTNIIEVTVLSEIIPEEAIGNTLDTITPYSVAIGLMVTFALTMIAYANQWKYLYLTPLFVYFCIVFSYIATSFHPLYHSFNQFYILIMAVFGLLFFYITGFRLKDNGSLGLGIFFTIAFASVIAGENVVGDILTFLIAIMGMIIALGYFQPYKQEVEE